MTQTLCDAIDALQIVERGFHFTTGGGPSSFVDFRQLRQTVQHTARKLNALGCQPGQRVVLVLPKQVDFVPLFLAIIRAGLVAVPVYPPPFTGNLEDYLTAVKRIANISSAQHLVTSDQLCSYFDSLGSMLRVISRSQITATDGQGNLPKVSASDPALIQFTSGSTGSPKGVELLHSNLMANASAIEKALEIDPMRDQGASWLPLHHDMGLIGFLITPIVTTATTWYLPPLQFARQPQRWLDLMSQTKATVSYAPNFGYELVSRRVKASQVEQWDLSAWRVAGCGGEPIQPDSLNSFARYLEPSGFRRTAFVPSYGMAEATVAVAISPINRGVVTGTPHDNSPTQSLTVSSGQAVADTDIRIVSTSGEELADGLEGEIQVRGPGVAKRFYNEQGYNIATDSNGWMDTGDLGFLQNAHLHVCGRRKESVLINGCNYYPQDIEACVHELAEFRAGSVVAFGRPGNGSEQLVLVAETHREHDAKTLQRQVRSSVRQRLGLSVADVVIVNRGTITRTTSGKLQRRALRARYLDGAVLGCQ